jgi:hypothetical protein
MSAFPALTHVAVTVSDLSVSVPWYARLIGAAPGLDHVAFGCADRGELEKGQRHLDELGVAHGDIVDASYGSGLSFTDPDNTSRWSSSRRPPPEPPTGEGPRAPGRPGSFRSCLNGAKPQWRERVHLARHRAIRPTRSAVIGPHRSQRCRAACMSAIRAGRSSGGTSHRRINGGRTAEAISASPMTMMIAQMMTTVMDADMTVLPI